MLLERAYMLSKGQLRSEFAESVDWKEKLWFASAFHARLGGFSLGAKQVRSMSSASDKRIFEIVEAGKHGKRTEKSVESYGIVQVHFGYSAHFAKSATKIEAIRERRREKRHSYSTRNATRCNDVDKFDTFDTSDGFHFVNRADCPTPPPRVRKVRNKIDQSSGGNVSDDDGEDEMQKSWLDELD